MPAMMGNACEWKHNGKSSLSSALRLAIWCVALLACRQDYPQGERLYRTYCANCHMEDGTGLAKLIPPLAKADFLSRRRKFVACIIRNGSQGGQVVNAVQFVEPMPSFSNLNEVQLSNLINYINTSWGNRLAATNPEEVEIALDACAD